MKVLFVLGRYLPEKNAGIENYSHWLATQLLEAGHDVAVAIMHTKDVVEYFYEGIRVIPLKDGYSSFIEIVDNQHFDYCHFQEYSGKYGIDVRWFNYAKGKQIKVYFTFHLPYLTCYKSDFRHMGLEDCNLFTDETRCAKCIIADRSGYTKSFPSKVKLGLYLIGSKVAGMTAILKTRVKDMHSELDELISVCDGIFIYGRWFKTLLNENGYRSPNLIEIPHITNSFDASEQAMKEGGIKNRLVFVGRIEKQKGLHLLCTALNMGASPEVQLDVYGNIVDEDYYNQCKKEYNFNYVGAVPRTELLAALKHYDFLVLPSVFTEMYSLVLKEAFYAQLPVIVSSAKGNRDAVIEAETGFIFNYNSSADLSQVVAKAYAALSSGWKPKFGLTKLQDEEIKKIASYYV